MAKQNKVAVNLAQDFTNEEKLQARANIGAGTGNGNSNISRFDLSNVEHEVEQMNIYQRSINNAEFRHGQTSLGSTVPTPSLTSEEGKVPVAYYRGGRGYFLLEKYKDSRLPDSSSSNFNQVLTVDSHGVANWANPATELPSHTSADAGKALILDSSGNPIWSDIDTAPTISRLHEYAVEDVPSTIGTIYGADHKRELHMFDEGTYPNTISSWIQEKDYKYGILHYTMALELWNSDSVTKWCVIDQGHTQDVSFHIIGKGLYIPFAPGHTYVPVDHTVVFLKSDVGRITSPVKVVMGLQVWPAGDPNFHANDMFLVSTIHSQLTLFNW